MKFVLRLCSYRMRHNKEVYKYFNTFVRYVGKTKVKYLGQELGH